MFASYWTVPEDTVPTNVQYSTAVIPWVDAQQKSHTDVGDK